jgi:hypothetical protein
MCSRFGVERLREFGNFDRLAAADQRGGIDRVATLHDAVDDSRSSSARERLELCEFRLE